MKIKNYTPHPIIIKDDQDRDINIPAEPNPIRISQKTTFVRNIESIPIYNKEFMGDINLPQLEEDTIYIVSSLVYDFIKKNFPDKLKYFVIPGDPIRDSNGNIIGCKGLNISL